MGEVEKGEGGQTYGDGRDLTLMVNIHSNIQMMYYTILYNFINEHYPNKFNLKNKRKNIWSTTTTTVTIY